jgi:predicted ATP-dependent serine protease
MSADIEKEKDNCVYYNGEFCTKSFYEQSFCVGKCQACRYKLSDYEAFSDDYPHLFGEDAKKKRITEKLKAVGENLTEHLIKYIENDEHTEYQKEIEMLDKIFRNIFGKDRYEKMKKNLKN